MKNTSTIILLFACSLFAVCQGQSIGNGVSRDHVGHETSSRHDSWQTNQWVPLDSNSFVRDAQLNPTANTYFNYNSGWVPVFTGSSTYDSHNDILTSITRYWNAGLSNFVNTYNYIATYNAANLPLTQTEQSWVNNAWRNTRLTSYVYGAHNNITQYMIQLWDTSGNAWINSVEYLYTYDVANNHLTNLSLDWNTGSSGWDTSTLDTYSYDANNHVLVHVASAWALGTLNSVGKTTNTYDGNGNLTTSLYQDSYDGVTFTNYSKDDYTYDAHNNMTTDHTTVWNSGTSSWDNFSIRSYAYNAANKQTHYEQQVWTNGAYVNGGGGNTGYDQYGNNNLLESLSWSSNLGWDPTYKDSIVFDINGNELAEFGWNYDTTTQTFINAGRETFWFANGTGITELNELNATLFPNPNNGKDISLQLNLPQDAMVGIYVYDISGKMVNTDSRLVNRDERLQLNYPTVGSGTYLLQLLDKGTGKSSVLRFVVK